MSGGSYDYFCFKLEQFAYDIRYQSKYPKRAAFAQLLLLCSEAAHDIEWVDSGDYGDGGEDEAIDKVFEFLTENPETIQKAAAYDKLQEVIKRYLEL
jgi:hypothetical protein